MNPRTINRGSDALVRGLTAAGVRRIFTLSGNHIMPVFDAALEEGIDLLHTRHEASTVHMADAFARVSGQVGIAMVTGGPGHANAVGALYTAQMAESPVVLLSGHAPHAQIGRGAFQEMRQAEMAEPVTKASWVCASAADVQSDIARAIRIARSGRPGPVHLSLPTDALENEAAPQASAAEAFEPEVAALAPQTAAELMQRMAQASRPMILVGPACLTRAGRKALASLEATSGIPVVGMESPRGISDPCLGAFAQVLAQADRLLLVGKRLDFTLAFGKAPFPVVAEVHLVDADAAEIDRTRRAIGERLGIAAQADALAGIDALTRAAGKPTSREWQDEVRSAVAYRPAAWDTAKSAQPGRLHPVQMLRPLQSVLDSHPDSVLVCDGGEIGQWASACLQAPHRVINGVAGAIGSGLPYALGARCAETQAPVVAVMGDGTVGFHIAEFDTAVRHRLPFVVVVGNDARWNAEFQIQLRDYGPERMVGCDLLPTRYDAVAQAFGAHGEFVTDVAQMASAVDRARHSGLPACVNAMIEGVPAPKITR